MSGIWTQGGFRGCKWPLFVPPDSVLPASCVLGCCLARPTSKAPWPSGWTGQWEAPAGTWEGGSVLTFSSPPLGRCVHPLKTMAPARWPSPHSRLSLSPDYTSLLLPFQAECGASRNALCLMIALPAPLYSIVIFIILSSKHKICMGHLPPVGRQVDPWGNPGAGRDPGQPTTLPVSMETRGLGQNTEA